MRYKRAPVVLALLVLPFTLAHGQDEPVVYGEEAFEAILQFYQYDVDIPLEARIVERVETDTHVREKVVFGGFPDGRVPAYLGIPAGGEPPYPVVFQINGLTGSKEHWWEDDSWERGGLVTKALLSSGYAVMAVEVPYHGERLSENDFESPGVAFFRHRWYVRSREMMRRSIIEHRRAIDYLGTLPEIDIDRIGVTGHSMGGIITFALNAVEPRIKTSVACVTPLNFWDIPVNTVYSPYNFARGIGERPFLMLMGRSDPWYTEDNVDALFDLIDGNPKKLLWFDSPHRLPADYIQVAADWFKEYL